MTSREMERRLGFFEVSPRIIRSAKKYLRGIDQEWVKAFEHVNLDVLIKTRDILRRERVHEAHGGTNEHE